ncbi:MAG: ATP-binding protein [Leptolyngbyaceae cyanobacterium bins.59]|nr:ATP-binding protein [Leptolyngbyaceae cyanobacterium bins.59]
MTHSQIFGEFLDPVPASEEYLTLHFSLGSTPRKQRWSNYGLSADFLGDYFAAFFPGDAVADSAINRRDTVKAAVSYIANELIENAVKYGDESANLPITITLYLYEKTLIFEVRNPTQRSRAEQYQAFIQELLSSDLDEFYTRQIEKTALGEGGSNLGVLTMINDYGAKFGWKFETIGEETAQVTVLVYLEV